jgi:hypothetical protein
MSDKISRRYFLKLTLTSLSATFLAACGRALGIPATSSPALAPASNFMGGILRVKSFPIYPKE